MAISTLQGVVDGLKPPAYWQKASVSAFSAPMVSQFYAAGYPAAAAAPSPGIDGAALTSYAGQIDFANPVSGNAYLAGVVCGTTNQTAKTYFMVLDRLWHNSGIDVTITTPQSITTPTWPARDRNGSADGDGVMVYLEVAGSLNTAGAGGSTISYTNSSGVSGRTGTLVNVAGSWGLLGSEAIFALQSGDVGVRSIQSFTLGATCVSGALSLVAARPVALVATPAADEPMSWDAVSLGFPRLYDDSVLYTIGGNVAGSGVSAMSATLQYAHG